mgnify:CR=1 FL=1
MIRKKEIGIPCYNMPLQLNIHFKNRLKVLKRLCRFFLIGGEEDVSCCWQQTSLCSSGLLPLLQSCNATHLCFFLRKSICVSTMICAKKNAILRVKQDCISWRRRRDSPNSEASETDFAKRSVQLRVRQRSCVRQRRTKSP